MTHRTRRTLSKTPQASLRHLGQPAPTPHTERCVQARASYAAALEEWQTAHPNYCRMCGGTGEIRYSYDPSPAGVSLGAGSLEDADPCSRCVERGDCPQCGKYGTLNDDGDHCSACGWQWGDGTAAPNNPECFCWEADFYGSRADQAHDRHLAGFVEDSLNYAADEWGRTH